MVMDYPGISLLLCLVAFKDVCSVIFRVDLKKTVYMQNKRFNVIIKAISCTCTDREVNIWSALPSLYIKNTLIINFKRKQQV